MGQTTNKVHKLTIRNKNPGKISHGATTQVLLDDKPLKMVQFIKLEFHAKRITKVTLEMFVDVEIDTDVELSHKNLKESDLKINGKPVALYQFGNYEPKAFAEKPAPAVKDCSDPQSYCNDCSCGKKEKYESDK